MLRKINENRISRKSNYLKKRKYFVVYYYGKFVVGKTIKEST